MKTEIWLSPPHLSGNEQAYVQEAFETNWVAPLGPHVDAFERALCQRTGAGHAAALSSGTAALHLALVLLGVGPGDEVLCQSLTFAASANPIVYQGARPVFVDSEPSTWNLCPGALEEALADRIRWGKRPKAVIAVDLYGMPARWDELTAVCSRYEVPLIEDAAEALGSVYRGRPCGSFGRLSVLSFNGNKIITTSGGGALLSADPLLIEQARWLAMQARDPAPHYQHSRIGYNYRLSNVCAGIGRAQLEVLADRVARRRTTYAFYRHHLAPRPGFGFLPEPEGCFSNRWLSCVTIDPEEAGITREDLRLALVARGIESRPLWKPLHRQPVFVECPFYGSGLADELFRTGLCLPSGSSLTEGQREEILGVIRAACPVV